MHPVGRRRRGSELEEALLDAAWQELKDNGYAGFTLEAVAARAGTSRPVLARRWASKHELLRAAVRQAHSRTVLPVPDTGSLRGDIIEMLREFNADRVDFATVLGVQLGGYYQETGSSLADLRDVIISGHDSTLEQVLQRAVDRGEADPAKLTPRIRTLPFDLFRQHILMTLTPMPEDAMEQIVDEIFLPLVTP
ncbi:TetR/AcrR family transcriptional regulator [Actinoplanes sp. N902-109]|uniref:TetR/AcrR family transcriptional regulator n=1 Tax=Actinoplanes sp. (strain N902-109) TaxID=649831 RepID=UPI000329435D|nr:TetR/AcrR family transcriptional regulator [Actinoplanes sp. N902-109]AGL14823.1 TetR family transcriptional regulator [Actinoplanes sp. N902-109]